MPKLPTPIFHVVTLVALVGGLAFAGASYADTPESPQYTSNETPPIAAKQAPKEKISRHQKSEEQSVEKRIGTLHDKLDITAAQEPKWADVAQLMRDNETAIAQLMKDRFENRKTMTAIDDLQSFENIAQAHTDGLKKMIPVFQALYTDMSDEQKKDADEAFGRFEGHRDGKHHPKHG